MFATQKLYQEDPAQLTCSAHVLDVLHDGEQTSVVLDTTVFRPHDITEQVLGVIESTDKAFHVTGVREEEDAVRHVGRFESDPFELDEAVSCVLNDEYKKELGARNE